MSYASAPASAARRLECALKRAIVSLEIPPGSRLSEADVAERHGVSRQPVREALISLARSKLVEILPQRGTVIAKISVGRMMQARFVREAVETAVVRRAAAHFDPAVRDRIDDLLETQAQVARADDHLGFQRYDELFHIALAEGAGCPLAWDAVRDLKTHMDRLCQLTLSGQELCSSSSISTAQLRRPSTPVTLTRRSSGCGSISPRSCERCPGPRLNTQTSSSNPALRNDARRGRVRELSRSFETPMPWWSCSTKRLAPLEAAEDPGQQHPCAAALEGTRIAEERIHDRATSHRRRSGF